MPVHPMSLVDVLPEYSLVNRTPLSRRLSPARVVDAQRATKRKVVALRRWSIICHPGEKDEAS